MKKTRMCWAFVLLLLLPWGAWGDMYETLPHKGDLWEENHRSSEVSSRPSGCRSSTCLPSKNVADLLAVREPRSVSSASETLVLYIPPVPDGLDLLKEARRLASKRGWDLRVFFSVSRDRLEDLSRFVIENREILFPNGEEDGAGYGVAIGHEAPAAEVVGINGRKVCSVRAGLRCP